MMCQKKELVQQTKELEECKAQNDLERRSLTDRMEKVGINFYSVPDTSSEYFEHFSVEKPPLALV